MLQLRFGLSRSTKNFLQGRVQLLTARRIELSSPSVAVSAGLERDGDSIARHTESPWVTIFDHPARDDGRAATQR
jgi:hypothetical protein